MDETAEGTGVPVTPTTSNTLTTNASTVTTTAMTNTEATTSGAGLTTQSQTSGAGLTTQSQTSGAGLTTQSQTSGAGLTTQSQTSGAGLTTQSQTSDVTSTTVNTVTTSLATLNLATDEASFFTSFPESIPLLDSVTEMQSRDLMTTDVTETLPSNRVVDSERPVMTNSENINLLQAAATQELGGSRTFSTTGGASATDEAKRWCPLCNPTEVSTQTLEGAHALAHDSDSQVAMERERHRFMNLTSPLTQGEEFSWDNIQFVSDLIFHTDICQSNANNVVERIVHMQRLTTWILQLLECDADCEISLRRELENLLESSISMASHLADPASHHDQGTFLMRPIFPEPRRLDSETLEFLSFDQNVYRPLLQLPLDRRPQSTFSQNSTRRVPSLWDEEQFEYSRNGDPMSPRLCTLHRESELYTRRTRHRSDELAELTLEECDRLEFTRVPRRRPSHLSERSPESRQSVESLAAQPSVSRLRVRHQGARNGARSNGNMDPSDDIVPLDEGEILVGRDRSRSSPMRLSDPRPNDWVSPLGPNQTVPTSVFPNGSDWHTLPRVPDAHMPFASMTLLDYENLGMRSESASNNSRHTSTVEMTGLDVNSSRVAGIVHGEQGAVGGQDSLPSLLLPEFSAVRLISEPFNHGASAHFTREDRSTHSGSLGRQDAREGRRELRGGAIQRFERLQGSRTRSSPELIFQFSDAEDLGLERYSPNQMPYISSSSSESISEASHSPVVPTMAGLNTYVYDSQASTLPVQDPVVVYSLPIDITGNINDYISEGNVTPEDSTSEEVLSLSVDSL